MKIVRRGDVVYVVPDDGANENETNGPVFTLRAKIDGKDSVIKIEPSELDALLEQLADYRAKKNGETDEDIVCRIWKQNLKKVKAIQNQVNTPRII